MHVHTCTQTQLSTHLSLQLTCVVAIAPHIHPPSHYGCTPNPHTHTRQHTPVFETHPRPQIPPNNVPKPTLQAHTISAHIHELTHKQCSTHLSLRPTHADRYPQKTHPNPHYKRAAHPHTHSQKHTQCNTHLSMRPTHAMPTDAPTAKQPTSKGSHTALHVFPGADASPLWYCWLCCSCCCCEGCCC